MIIHDIHSHETYILCYDSRERTYGICRCHTYHYHRILRLRFESGYSVLVHVNLLNVNGLRYFVRIIDREVARCFLSRTVGSLSCNRYGTVCVISIESDKGYESVLINGSNRRIA